MDSSEIKIFSYEPKWEASHQVFARQYFHNRRKRIDLDYIYWKFRGEPDGLAPSLLLAIHNNEIVGQLGLVPATIQLKGQLFEAHWACDLMVSNEYRGQGIASMLYNEASKMKITLGSDPSPAAAKSMLKFGFKEIAGPTKLFFPLRLNAITDKKVKRLSSIAKHISNPWLLKSFFSGTSVQSSKKTAADITPMEMEWLVRQFSPLRIWRNTDFYKWRLGAFKDYQTEGHIVSIKDSFFAAVRGSKTTVFISDIHSKNVEQTKAVLKQLIKEGYKIGAQEIRIMTGDAHLLKMLKSLGFIAFRTPTKIIYYAKDETFLNEIGQHKYFDYTFLDSDENI